MKLGLSRAARVEAGSLYGVGLDIGVLGGVLSVGGGVLGCRVGWAGSQGWVQLWRGVGFPSPAFTPRLIGDSISLCSHLMISELKPTRFLQNCFIKSAILQVSNSSQRPNGRIGINNLKWLPSLPFPSEYQWLNVYI